jgi:hypothetical protein
MCVSPLEITNDDIENISENIMHSKDLIFMHEGNAVVVCFKDRSYFNKVFAILLARDLVSLGYRIVDSDETFEKIQYGTCDKIIAEKMR